MLGESSWSILSIPVGNSSGQVCYRWSSSWCCRTMFQNQSWRAWDLLFLFAPIYDLINHQRCFHLINNLVVVLESIINDNRLDRTLEIIFINELIRVIGLYSPSWDASLVLGIKEIKAEPTPCDMTDVWWTCSINTITLDFIMSEKDLKHPKLKPSGPRA